MILELLLAVDETVRGWTLWAAIIILCREILVSGLREYLAALRVSVPVTKLAKWKTTVQLVAIGFLDPAAPKKLMPRLNQLFNRAQPTPEEIHILRGVAKAMAEAARKARP